MPGDMTCPRCGTHRLIRRLARIGAPTWRTRIALPLLLQRLLAGERGQKEIVRHTYVCELCANRWSVDELIDTAPSIDAHDDEA